jgi:type IV pilus assembly protein PilM
VVGYGTTSFDPKAIENGIIVKPELIAEATLDLYRNHLIGAITTKRVALSVPVAKAFIRVIDTPKLSEKELAEAVHNEVEQYIPMPEGELYVDYEQVPGKKGAATIFVVAVPRKVVDSYTMVARMLGLEPVIVQTSSGAGARLFSYDKQSGLPTVLVDFGSDSADVTIYDTNPIVTGTTSCGGEQITETIAAALGVSQREAVIIKSRYGLTVSKKQAQIEAALRSTLGSLTREIRRTIRYYSERSKDKRAIEQIVVMGGGANMPGLAEYLTSDLRLPVRAFDPSAYVNYGTLQPVSAGERMSYVTAAGLASFTPTEAFRL